MTVVAFEKTRSLKNLRADILELKTKVHNLERYRDEVFRREITSAADVVRNIVNHVNELTKIVNQLQKKDLHEEIIEEKVSEKESQEYPC